MKKLKEQRGEFLLDGSLRILLTCCLLALFLSVLGVLFQANKLATMADDVARYIEISGQVNHSDVNTELQRLRQSSGLRTVDIHVDANYTAGGSCIQFGDPFTVTLTYEGKLGVGGIVSLPIPLCSSVTGRSERYWKQ
jgi:hypothetical protein